MKPEHRHLVRAGLVLLLIIGAVLVLPRLLPSEITSALKPYGFYAERDNSSEWANLPLNYADHAKCNACHENKIEIWTKSEHKTVSCENCHGPGETHVEQTKPLVVDTSRELCAQCHGKVIGRPADFPQVDVSLHGGQSQCIACHDPHDPIDTSPAQSKTQRLVSTPQIPHELEGRADCLLCHQTNGIKPSPKNHAGRGKETCLSCHNGGGR